MVGPPLVAAGVALSSAAAGAAVVSSLSLRGNEYALRPAYQPESAAFGIWGLLFAGSIAQGIAAALGRGSSARTCLLLGASYALSAAWAPLFAHERYDASAVLVAGAAALATAAACTTPTPTTLTDWLLVELPSGLLAGWLLVAATLGASIAVLARAGPRYDTPWAALAPVAIAGALAILRRKPLLVAPLGWAFAFVVPREPRVATVGLTAAATSAVAAAARFQVVW